MDNEDLQRLEAIDEEKEFDEMVECQMEDTKNKYHENLVLLKNLLIEVSTQIQTLSPNIVKIKEMIELK